MEVYSKVNILGTTYTIYDDVSEADETLIKGCDGITDFSTHKIYIAPLVPNSDTMKDLERYKKRTIRHEIIHAVLFESGLDHNTKWARNEEIVDWIAIQFPKLLDIFKNIEVESF